VLFYFFLEISARKKYNFLFVVIRHSEFKMGLTNDKYREWHLFKTFGKPNHVFSQFCVGNLETL